MSGHDHEPVTLTPKKHKQHSTPCEIAAQAASLRAGMANGQMSFNSLSHGLPGIGEEMQM